MDSATAQAHLDSWLAADQAVSTGQAYTIGNRSLTRANTEEIRQQITYWNGQVSFWRRQEAGMHNPGIIYARWT